jgi:hypothetical protein
VAECLLKGKRRLGSCEEERVEEKLVEVGGGDAAERLDEKNLLTVMG